MTLLFLNHACCYRHSDTPVVHEYDTCSSFFFLSFFFALLDVLPSHPHSLCLVNVHYPHHCTYAMAICCFCSLGLATQETAAMIPHFLNLTCALITTLF